MTAIDLAVGLLVRPTLILAMAAALASCLRRHSAAARHSVWAAGIVATLASPALGLLVPEIRIPVLPAAVPRPSSVSLPALSPPPGVVDAREAKDVAPPPALRRESARGSDERVSLAIVALWFLGAAWCGGRRIHATLRVRDLLARTRPVTDARILSVFDDMAGRREERIRSVDVRIDDELQAPATAGVFRRVVVLPRDAREWSEADLAAVFAHELGHVTRRDCLVHLIADVAAGVYWCNPLVRVAVRRLKSESERACDDAVLRSGVGPRPYARLLLRIAAGRRMSAEIPDAAIAMARPRELESRLLAVLDDRTSRRPLPRWMAAGLAGIAMLGSLPAVAFTVSAAQTAAPHIVAPEPDRRGDALARPTSQPLTASPSTVTTPDASPERRGDALAQPASERLSWAPPSVATSDTDLARAGPDSALARRLIAASRHVPNHEGDLVRERAAWALAQARDGRLVEPLLGALDDPDWRVRAYAAWALAGERDPRIVPRLVELLDHPVWRVRAMAAFAIRASGDPRADTSMLEALADPAWQVRVEAVEYLGALAGPRLHERLTPYLSDRHVAVRFAVEQALTH